ncbi:MAG TPA: hypothetical protein VGG48_01905 [Rhizomicrobium sp.]
MQGQEAGDVSRMNAKGDFLNAEQAQQTGNANAALAGQDLERKTAEARAAISASGVDANTGSPLAVMHDLVTQGALQKKLIEYQGQTTSTAYLNKSMLDSEQATADRSAGYIAAGSTVLTAADNALQQSVGGGFWG